MRGKIFTAIFIAALGGIGLLMQFTSPGQAGPLGILAVFGLMYISALCVLSFLIIITNRVVVRYGTLFLLRKPVLSISWTKAYYFASVLALGPVMLLGMQSVGGVGLYEVCLVFLFLSISCIYIGKRLN